MVCRTGVILFIYLFSFAFFRRVKTDFPRRTCLALLARFALAFALLKNRLFSCSAGYR